MKTLIASLLLLAPNAMSAVVAFYQDDSVIAIVDKEADV